jgi:hypothetical protein
MKCYKCNEEYEEGFSFCPHCGAANRQEQRKCPYCAEWIEKETTLCRFCGEKTSAVTTRPSGADDVLSENKDKVADDELEGRQVPEPSPPPQVRAKTSAKSNQPKARTRCIHCSVPMRVLQDIELVCSFCKRRIAKGKVGVAGVTPVPKDRVKHERNVFLILSFVLLAFYVGTAILIILAGQHATSYSEVQDLNTLWKVFVAVELIVGIIAVVRVGSFLEYSGAEWVGVILAVLLCWLVGYLLVFVSVIFELKKVYRDGYPRRERVGWRGKEPVKNLPSGE